MSPKHVKRSIQISVLLPVYNGGSYLPEAVESILVQSYSDFELIVVDDGSTDQSCAIIERYARGDNRIQLISLPANLGCVAALNRGLAAASGDIIARMDQDDVALPRRFERQLKFLQHYPKVGVLGTTLELIDRDSQPAGTYWLPETHFQIAFGMLFNNPIADPSVMFRRRVAAVNDLWYDQTLGGAEDYAMWSTMLRYTRAHNLAEPLLRYRLHESQMSRTGAAHMQSAAASISDRLLSEIDPRLSLSWQKRQTLYRLYRHLAYAFSAEFADDHPVSSNQGRPRAISIDDQYVRRGEVQFQRSDLTALIGILNSFLWSTRGEDPVLEAITRLL